MIGLFNWYWHWHGLCKPPPPLVLKHHRSLVIPHPKEKDDACSSPWDVIPNSVAIIVPPRGQLCLIRISARGRRPANVVPVHSQCVFTFFSVAAGTLADSTLFCQFVELLLGRDSGGRGLLVAAIQSGTTQVVDALVELIDNQKLSIEQVKQ